MGLPRKIALTGGLLIAAIVGVAILAKKTNILSGITTGLSNIGSSLGLGVGTGVRNFGTGVIGGFTGIGQKQAGANLTSNFAGLRDLLSGINPFEDPQVQAAYGDTGDSAGAAAASNTTVVPGSREYSDLSGRVLNISTGARTTKPATIVSSNPIAVSINSGKPIQTVDIRTSSGFFAQPLAARLQAGQQAVKNYVAPKPTAAKAVTGGSRPANTSSASKSLTKSKR